MTNKNNKIAGKKVIETYIRYEQDALHIHEIRSVNGVQTWEVIFSTLENNKDYFHKFSSNISRQDALKQARESGLLQDTEDVFPFPIIATEVPAETINNKLLIIS